MGILVLIVLLSFTKLNKTLPNEYQLRIPYTRVTNNSDSIHLGRYNINDKNRELSTVSSLFISSGLALVQGTNLNLDLKNKSAVSKVRNKRVVMIFGVPLVKLITPMAVGLGSAIVTQYFIHNSLEKKLCILNKHTHMIENELPKLKGRHYFVILSLENEFFERLYFDTYSSFDCSHTIFGVWVFKCGTFWNKGKLTDSNWAYGSYDNDCKTVKNGAQIFFNWDDCLNLFQGLEPDRKESFPKHRTRCKNETITTTLTSTSTSSYTKP